MRVALSLLLILPATTGTSPSTTTMTSTTLSSTATNNAQGEAANPGATTVPLLLVMPQRNIATCQRGCYYVAATTWLLMNNATRTTTNYHATLIHSSVKDCVPSCAPKLRIALYIHSRKFNLQSQTQNPETRTPDTSPLNIF